jgi:site-specific DNA-adenine methylase
MHLHIARYATTGDPKVPPLFRHKNAVGQPKAFAGISLPTWTPRWINDINPHLMQVFKALRDDPNDVIEKCVEIPPADPNEPTKLSAMGHAYPIRLTKLFNELLANDKSDQARYGDYAWLNFSPHL